MKNDDVTWLAAELGLPTLEETASGLLASPAARELLTYSDATEGADGVVDSDPAMLGTHTQERSSIIRGVALNEAAAVIMGIAIDHVRLLAAIAAARGGDRHSTEIGPNSAGQSFRLLATPAADAQRIRLTIAPARDAHAGEALVDVAAAVSHEVANAVSSIRGWAELALQGGTPLVSSDPRGAATATVDIRDALGLIRTAARSAEQAARSMLALARGQAHQADEPLLDLSVFADELLQLLTLTARESRVTLEAVIEPGLVALASRAQLFTILFNLVKNAIEACAPGGLVRVRLQAEHGLVKVSVTDNGPGLDAAQKLHLFERYFTTKATGTGLGLSLVKRAVEASGATIEVDSEPGRGTMFRVFFTRAADGDASSLPGSDNAWSSDSGESDTSGQRLDIRVLVVDDDQALREMLATALSLRGAEVVSVRSSQEALLLGERFDIALIDMMLDDCRGDELLALLRQRGNVDAAMLVTGAVQKPRLVPGGEPDDWVRKPFEISHLVERIRRTLERHRMLDTARQHTARA